jgi:hypothetical protein
MILLAFTQSAGSGLYLSVALLISGLVCSSRFIASDHSQKEVYGGLLGGIIALVIAALFVGV